MWKDYKYSEKAFILMPIMHSENKEDAALCCNAFTVLQKQANADGNTSMAGMFGAMLNSAKEHRIPIDKFGRYPTRNQTLGRDNTVEEDKYLANASGWGQ